MGVYGTMKFEKPLSAYTNEELLEYLGITATEDEVFRNYNYNKQERRKYILNLIEKNQYNCVSVNKDYLIIINEYVLYLNPFQW